MPIITCPVHFDPHSKQKRKAVALCHHCGQVLCHLLVLNRYGQPKNPEIQPIFCGYTIDDPYFVKQEKGQAVCQPAHHCRKCLIEYHRMYRVPVQRLLKRYGQL